MSNRFCYWCRKHGKHSTIVDVWGNGSDNGILKRAFLAVVSLGASEAMADRHWQCQECGATRRK